MDTFYVCDKEQFDYKQDQYLEIPIPKEMISKRLRMIKPEAINLNNIRGL